MDSKFVPSAVIPPNSSALLFDCDGTIADTMSIHRTAWLRTLESHGLILGPEFLQEYAGIPTVQILESLSKLHQLPLPVAQVAMERDALAETLLVNVSGIAPVIEIINEYAMQIPMAVVSGGSRLHVEKTLHQLNLLDRFEVVLTADDPFPPKPNPDLFLEAARQLGVDALNCVVFEDGEPGLVAARKAQMTAIDVRDFPNYAS